MIFYIFSDCHGFYDELINALDEAGFDKNNPEHFLIGAGDFIDRGSKPIEVIDYLMNLERFIGIRGNHEILMEELLCRGYPKSHDWSNGTMQSVIDLAPDAKVREEAFSIADKKLKPFYDKLVNYVELKNYVITHGFIPVNCKGGLPQYYYNSYRMKKNIFSKRDDWRNASQFDWNEATWLNGMAVAMNGVEIEKCIIVGHYHTSWGHAIQDKTFNEFGKDADFSPFYYKDKLIAIDGCTAHSRKVNVVVLEDDFLEE